MSAGRRPLRTAAALLVAGAVLVALVAGRFSLYRLAGRALVSDDPIRPADAIVIAVDGGDAGVLEAADLVRAGFSQRVVLFDDPPEEPELELTRRGLSHEREVDRATRQLHALGVERVERIPGTVDGTADEGRAFPVWCDDQRIRSVIVVSSADHSRRVRRTLRRAMAGHATAVMVRRARYSEFDPLSWWQKRGGIRTEIVEFEKLLLDVLLHPLS